MRCFSGLALAILSVFLCAAVSAATVKLVSGDVLINRGNGFEHVRGTSEAKVGDSVMARPNGSGRVIYDDTCWVPVKPGHVVVIALEPPCKKTASFDPYGMRMNVGAHSGTAFQDHHWLPLALIGAQFVVVGLCIGDVICDRAASP